MRFTKMQGAGNDYVFVNCFQERFPADPAELSRRVSDRHLGIGGDGLILICPSQRADARMRMYNADGLEAEMCGNGLRCVAKYVYEKGIAPKNTLRIETGRGVLSLKLQINRGRVARVCVDMGEPVLEASAIPTTLTGNPPTSIPLSVAGQTYRVTCVSLGNPHCVQFVDDVDRVPVPELGPLIETDAHFPKRTNVEFVQLISPEEIRLRVWERGAGETQACGTGACAAAVVGVLTGFTGREVLAHLPGGDLEVKWAEDRHVYLTGPAEEVFSGDWPDGLVQN